MGKCIKIKWAFYFYQAQWLGWSFEGLESLLSGFWPSCCCSFFPLGRLFNANLRNMVFIPSVHLKDPFHSVYSDPRIRVHICLFIQIFLNLIKFFIQSEKLKRFFTEKRIFIYFLNNKLKSIYIPIYGWPKKTNIFIFLISHQISSRFWKNKNLASRTNFL